jgi:hypothetical protein
LIDDKVVLKTNAWMLLLAVAMVRVLGDEMDF